MKQKHQFLKWWEYLLLYLFILFMYYLLWRSGMFPGPDISLSFLLLKPALPPNKNINLEPTRPPLNNSKYLHPAHPPHNPALRAVNI